MQDRQIMHFARGWLITPMDQDAAGRFAPLPDINGSPQVVNFSIFLSW